jgi:hypothetical protein
MRLASNRAPIPTFTPRPYASSRSRLDRVELAASAE